jgi:hypothetical protein
MRSMWLGLGSIAFAVLVFASPVAARGIRCEDIARERARGKSASEIAEALDTTRTRIAACAHLAAELARHESRRAEILARQGR